METNPLIIFDLDGVIVDTEYNTFLFYKEILPRYGITLQESDFQYKVGRKSIDFFKDVLKDKFNATLVQSLISQKRSAFLSDIRKHIRPIPQTIALIKELHYLNFPLALGSQNERELIEKVLDEFELRGYFSLIKSLQDITNKKPDPEIFLSIAKALGVAPEHSVVIEDSIDGVQAAKAGGFKVIAIASLYHPQELPADLNVKSAKEITPKLLIELASK